MDQPKRIYTKEEDEAFVAMLKARLTRSERTLRRALYEAGIRMKCQCRVGRYVADFYSSRAKLVVEVDGSYHDRRGGKEYDLRRDADIRELGILTLRFRNEMVENNLEGVLSIVRREMEKRTFKKKALNKRHVMQRAMDHLNVREC
jgi:very-short-patch-repair endonuclease